MQPTAIGISTCSPGTTTCITYCIMEVLAMLTQPVLGIACNAVMQSHRFGPNICMPCHSRSIQQAKWQTGCTVRGGRSEDVTLTASSPVLNKSCRGRTITRGSRELYALMLSSSSWHTRTCRATSALLTWQQDCHLWLTDQQLDSCTCKRQHV